MSALVGLGGRAVDGDTWNPWGPNEANGPPCGPNVAHNNPRPKIEFPEGANKKSHIGSKLSQCKTHRKKIAHLATVTAEKYIPCGDVKNGF